MARSVRAVFLKLLQQYRCLQLLLVLSWLAFGLAGILVSAFCVRLIFFADAPEQVQSFPVGLLQFVMLLAALRLLSLALADLHARLGLYWRQRDSRRAESHFQWALRMTPGDPAIYCDWGAMLREQRQYARARYLFEQALALGLDLDQPRVELAHLALQQGQWDQALHDFDRAYRIRRGVAWNELPEHIPEEDPLPPQIRALETSLTKLRHDAAQLAFLLQGNYLSNRFEPLLAAYQALLAAVPAGTDKIQLSKAQHQSIHLLHGRNFYIAPVPAFPRQVLNPELDWARIQQAYLSAEPGLVVIDNLLQPDATEALLHFCQKSAIWHDDARPGAYLGAYMDDGFSCGLLYQVAEALQQALPEVIQGAPLKHMWAYKYDSEAQQGIQVHADGARVNLNFWVTPDSANRNPESGGLLVYHAKAPADWDFEDYNHDTARTEAFLATQQAGVTRVPYRQNRAVLFDSRLFHATDSFDFAPEYLNWRINITLLYG